MLNLLGEVPDGTLARALHKIQPAEYATPPLHTWTEAEESLLGTMSDGNVARRLQIPTSKVSHHRKTLGIAPFNRTATVRWTSDKVARLGKEPDHALARQWEYPQSVIRQKRESLEILGIQPLRRCQLRWTEDVIKRLGVVSDGELAVELGCSRSLVAMKRRELQIPPVTSE